MGDILDDVRQAERKAPSPSNRDFYKRCGDEIERLRTAARLALEEMCNTVAPRDSFTDAVDALDEALCPPGTWPGR